MLIQILLLVPGLAGAAERFGRGHHLGFSVGTPAGLNLESRREFGRSAFTLAGGYWGSLYGVQGGIAATRWGNQRTYFVGNVVAGHSFIRDHDTHEEETWTYFGGEVAFHHRRFFIAPGLSAGGGTFRSPQLLARAGFVWPL
jgi:hypothetical protein